MFIRKENPLRMEDEALQAELTNLGAGPDGVTGFRLKLPQGVIGFSAVQKPGAKAIDGDESPRAIWEVMLRAEDCLPLSVADARSLIAEALSEHKFFYGRPEGAAYSVTFRAGR